MTYNTTEDNTRHKHKHKHNNNNKNKKSPSVNKNTHSQPKQRNSSTQREQKQRLATMKMSTDTHSDPTLEVNVLSTNTNTNTSIADSQVDENKEEKVNSSDSCSSSSSPNEMSSLLTVNESHSVWRNVSVKSSVLSLREIQEQQRREQQHQIKATTTTNEKSTSLCDVPPFDRPPVEKSARDPVLLSDFIPLQRPSPSSTPVFKEVPKSPPKGWNIQHQNETSRKVVSLREIQEQELAQKSQAMSGNGQEFGLGRMTRTSSAWVLPPSSSPARISLLDIQREEKEKEKQQKKLFYVTQIGERAVHEIEEFYRHCYQDEVIVKVRKLPHTSNSQHKSDNNKQSL
jgi:hypothetical protein